MIPNPLFIGISGKAKSGKDTIADIIMSYCLKSYLTVEKYSFANPMKRMLCSELGWDLKLLTDNYSYKESGDDYICKKLGLTRRQIMQKFGTDAIRNNLHKDFWVILAQININKLDKHVYIIPDVRYENELNFIKENNGICIRVDSNNQNNTPNHNSETEWQTYTFDYYINNIINNDNSLYTLQQLVECTLQEIFKKHDFYPFNKVKIF